MNAGPARTGPHIVVKRSSGETDEAAQEWLRKHGKAWMSSEAGFIKAFIREKDGMPFRLEPYQVNFMGWTYPDGKRPNYRAVTKSRQVGFSFAIALEALARCHLRNGYQCNIISYNQRDAQEKIGIIRAFYDMLPAQFKKKLTVDTKGELEFASPTGKRADSSRTLCLPCKPARGMHGDVVFDELAHYLNDSTVYTGSTALLIHGTPRPQCTASSTPLGKRGMHYEIISRANKPYSNYKRFYVPWWVSRFLCHDVRGAVKLAPHVPTHERVSLFGNKVLKEQFESLAIEDFQQEFECSFVDESFSYYPYDLIIGATNGDMMVAEDVSDLDLKNVTGRLVCGVDIGRTRDLTEIAVFEEQAAPLTGETRYVCRMTQRLERTPFRQQEDVLRRVLKALPLSRMSIDRTGIGFNLAENLATDFPDVVRSELFTNETKERWATNMKILMQQDWDGGSASKRIVLPARRDVVFSVHSIRKSVTKSGKSVFDADRSAGTGHADLFWAMALACQKEYAEKTNNSAPLVNFRVLG